MAMIVEQLIDDIHSLKMSAMARELSEQRNNPSLDELGFHPRLALLVNREVQERKKKSLDRRMKAAKMKITACPEDLIYERRPGLDRQVMSHLFTCDFIEQGNNIIVEGATGSGKTHVICTVGNQAVRMGYHIQYVRLPRFLEELEIARADGSIARLRSRIAKKDLLIIDDWALATLTDISRAELLEIVDDRIDKGSLAIASQVPVDVWHDWLGEATIADAIMDRIVHRSHRLKLSGESMRKRLGKLALAASEKGGES